MRVSDVALGTGRACSREILDAFAHAGGTFIDTSSAYLAGASEETIGTWLADAGRDRFVIATKYARIAGGNHRGAMRTELETSLRRLKTDRIDLFFAHFDDGVTPIDEIMRGLDDLVRAGKIIHIGLSNFPAWRSASAAALADVRGWTPLAALQLQYSLLSREIEREHLPHARANQLAVMAYSPLAAGQLAKGALPLVDTIARELGTTPIAVALAWVRAKDLIPVLGPRDAKQLAENLVEVSLDATHVQFLDDATAIPHGYPYEILDTVRSSLGIVAS
jgi:aryl-alcohol dehydrogenase-like predicted oxidoreductase